MLKPGDTSLEEAFRAAVNERWGFRIPDGAWNWDKLPNHLKMRFRIRDPKTGRTIVCSRDLQDVLPQASPSQPSQPSRQSQSSQSWTFGTIPAKQTDKNSGWATISYPALHDEGDGVTLKLYPHAATASAVHATGVTRLYLQALPELKRKFSLKSNNSSFNTSLLLDAALYLKDINYGDDKIADDVLAGAIRETLVRSRPEVRTAEEFERRLKEDRSPIIRTQSEMTQVLIESAATATKLYGLLAFPRRRRTPSRRRSPGCSFPASCAPSRSRRSAITSAISRARKSVSNAHVSRPPPILRKMPSLQNNGFAIAKRLTQFVNRTIRTT